MIINIRGTSGSGKSTLVHRYLEHRPSMLIERQLDSWKKPKTVAYMVNPRTHMEIEDAKLKGLYLPGQGNPTYIIGRYETQCGGCDSMSYKGSHDDIEALVREFLPWGNVIFEGLTISSTITRWLRISKENPGQFIWAFMDTPEEECYRRILARSGREPKRDERGLADYQRKWRGCEKHVIDLSEQGEKVVRLSSDEEGYKKLVGLLA